MLDRALTELEDRGLIGWDREANRYDAHPIVRGVVWQLTEAKDQQAVYAALEAHFEPMATPEWKKVETLGDLTPAIERYHTLVGLGRYDDACALFRDRLEEATLFRLAAHRERIAWLERLFPDGAAGLPAVTTGGDQSYALNVLAQSYRFSGQPGRSAPLFRRASEIDESRGDARSLRVVLTNLGDALREIGALREAVGALRRALVLKIAAHLMSRGFDVYFHDLENGGGYDFLASSDGRKIEVECKYISGDTGRKIHRRKLYDLGGLLSPIMSRAAEGKRGGIHLRVDLPDRLHSSKEQQQAVASQIQMALTDEIASENEVCGVSIERFDISSSLFSAERGTTVTEDDTREFCNVRGLESGHTLFRWTPGKTAIVVSLKSRKEDIVLAMILERLKQDAKRQFTRQLPALICVHIADLSEKQLLDIAEVDKSETPTGIRIVLSKLLRERPHVHTVALMTDGSVRVEQNQIGNLCTTSTQETGRTYIVRNPDHPQANDLVLKSVFAKTPIPAPRRTQNP